MTALPASIYHTFHQNHKLSLVTTPASGFQCDGCKQYGVGSEHYRCEACNFDLHTQCAFAPETLDHTLFVGRTFCLIENHTTQNGYMTCQACRRDTVGFRYFNQALNLYLHPCCAVLPMRVVQDDRVFQLLKDASVMCGICDEKSESLCYRTSSDNGEHVCLHVPCLVRLNDKLTGYQDWQASAPIMQGVRALLTTTQKNNVNGGAVVNGNRGASALKTAGTVFNVLSLVFHVVTLDPAGIAESAANLFE